MKESMRPSFGMVLWVLLGALTGWFATKVLGTEPHQLALGYVALGVVGALIGGFVTTLAYRDSPSNRLFVAALLAAMLGSLILLGAYKAYAVFVRPRAHQ